VNESPLSLIPKFYDSLFVIKVDGKSMEPVIKDRTLVVADLSQREVEVRVVAKAVLSFNSF